MSFMNWLNGLLGSKTDDSDESMETENNPFEVSQHIRIVIALAVVVISAFVMWWILE